MLSIVSNSFYISFKFGCCLDNIIVFTIKIKNYIPVNFPIYHWI